MKFNPCRQVLTNSDKLRYYQGLQIEEKNTHLLTRIWRWLTGQYDLRKIERAMCQLSREILTNPARLNAQELTNFAENYRIIVLKFKNNGYRKLLLQNANKQIQEILKLAKKDATTPPQARDSQGLTHSFLQQPRYVNFRNTPEDYFTPAERAIKAKWVDLEYKLDDTLAQQPRFWLNKQVNASQTLVDWILADTVIGSVPLKQAIPLSNLLEALELSTPRHWITKEIEPTEIGLKKYFEKNRARLVSQVVEKPWFDDAKFYEMLPTNGPRTGSVLQTPIKRGSAILPIPTPQVSEAAVQAALKAWEEKFGDDFKDIRGSYLLGGDIEPEELDLITQLQTPATLFSIIMKNQGAYKINNINNEAQFLEQILKQLQLSTMDQLIKKGILPTSESLTLYLQNNSSTLMQVLIQNNWIQITPKPS